MEREAINQTGFQNKKPKKRDRYLHKLTQYNKRERERERERECVCVRACVRACVRVCMCVRVCVHIVVGLSVCVHITVGGGVCILDGEGRRMFTSTAVLVM